MEAPPDDSAGRREWLERWVAEQGLVDPRPPARLTRWGKLASAVRNRRRMARAIQWLGDRVLGRGLDTAKIVREPVHEHPDRVGYVASPWHVLPRALHYLGVSDRDTFVEFGCGKGRVVHQAARRPFRRVIGVEISPALAEIARANLAARSHQHRCRDVEIVVSDATQFQVPDDLTIAYLYNPFSYETLDTVLGGIVRSIDRNPRRVQLIYVAAPQDGSPVLATGRFRLLKEQRSRFLDACSTAIYEIR